MKNWSKKERKSEGKYSEYSEFSLLCSNCLIIMHNDLIISLWYLMTSFDSLKYSIMIIIKWNVAFSFLFHFMTKISKIFKKLIWLSKNALFKPSNGVFECKVCLGYYTVMSGYNWQESTKHTVHWYRSNIQPIIITRPVDDVFGH